MLTSAKARNYLQHCAECDSILKQGFAPLRLVAISWLHVLNEHPSNLLSYLGTKPHVFKSIAKFMGKAVLSRLPGSLKNAFSPRWFISMPLPHKVDVLFVSHLLNESQAAQADDFYFGSLAQHGCSLSQKNVVTLQRLDIKISAQKAAALSAKTGVPRLFFSSWAKPHEEVYFSLVQIFTFCQLFLEGLFFNRNAVHASTYRKAAAHALSSSTTENLRFHHVLVRWFKQFKPSAVVLTFEGHAWERMVIAAARQSGIDIKCTGYHHAIFFPRQHAVARQLGHLFDPDHMYFAGEVTKQAFQKCTDMKTPCDAVGTHRSEVVCSELPNQIIGNTICLVLPDGTFSECLLMISFALRAAKAMPNVRFVVRLHPVVVYKDLVEKNPELDVHPDNFELSTLHIERDFERCRWAVYRGSGAGVRAAAVGLRPLYLDNPEDLLPIDPMIDLKDWRKAIDGIPSLIEVIENDRACDWMHLNNEFILAKDYLSNYFMPIQHDKFFRLLYA